MSKKSRNKKFVTQPRVHSPVPANVVVKPPSQTQVRTKADITNPSRLAHVPTELKTAEIIAGLIIIGIVILYLVSR
jgi:hypothetical protein